MATVEKAENSRQLKGLKFKTQKALDGDGKDSLITEDSKGKTIVNLGTDKELFSEGKDGDELTIKEGKIVGSNGQEKYAKAGTGGKQLYSHCLRLNTSSAVGGCSCQIVLATNQVIDSLTDLFTVLGNRTIAVVGYLQDGSGNAKYVDYVKVGTTVANSYIHVYGPGEQTFSAFGITTVSDSVFSI